MYNDLKNKNITLSNKMKCTEFQYKKIVKSLSLDYEQNTNS